MQTGQYYYNHLPQRIREEFSHNCNVRISYVLEQKYSSLSQMINESFSPYYTKQGGEYWQHVAHTCQPGLKTKLIVFVEKHAIASVISASATLIISAIILVSAIQNDREKTERIIKQNEELSRRDSIIHAAEHIDSIKTDMIGQRPSFDEMRKGWEFKGAITTDSVNSWMDRIMSENKVSND